MEYVYIIVGTIVVIAFLSWLILRGGSAEGRPVGQRERDTQSMGGGAGRAEGGEVGESGQKRNWLIGQSGEVEDKTFHVGDRTVTIGRKPTNFIQLGDSEVSRVHAQLRPAGARCAIVDMNSSTGTYLNGQKLSSREPQPLEGGDTIKIAGIDFKYEMTGNYEENFGVSSAKATGRKFETSTKMTGGAEWRDTILEKLQETGGDPKAAAELMGMETEVFIQMMEQANVSPDDVQ
ncbi:MAG: FHA domain-containing protein [Bradymonadaceae bacterium]